ncbi:hypothetical protein C8F04DRAFT_1198125 [Mycena alexandri]|uniref:Uncharacterized protein n=1 Tax=Mycena alexandri TaxID=1745969 RepID=A0AAD6S254_9AGAR|nr:hypothetical protein C8F04DRAFT_1198125 [Mycena alexandri]
MEALMNGQEKGLGPNLQLALTPIQRSKNCARKRGVREQPVREINVVAKYEHPDMGRSLMPLADKPLAWFLTRTYNKGTRKWYKLKVMDGYGRVRPSRPQNIMAAFLRQLKREIGQK